MASSIDFALSAPEVQPAIAVLVAFVIDHCLGEPPAVCHPVVWMGKALASTGAPWVHRRRLNAFVRGAVVWLIGASTAAGIAWAAGLAIAQLGEGVSTPGMLLLRGALLGVLLKPLLAWRMLRDEVASVEAALQCGVETGRSQLRQLVSRDTGKLTASEVRESALESLAENLNDSFVAPLFWFCVGGLPAAALYRFANTADAMWGYRGRWEWAGKWAARADDVLSYAPARVTAALIAVAAWRSSERLADVARVTPSPNGGWPMGMLALALGVRLGKPGVYVLNETGAAPLAADLRRGLRICGRAAWLSALTSALLLVAARWR